MEPVSPASPEWNQWATLANHVTDALGTADLRERPLFSERTRIATALWEMGYRPTRAQIVALMERQKALQTHRTAPKSDEHPRSAPGAVRDDESASVARDGDGDE